MERINALVLLVIMTFVCILIYNTSLINLNNAQEMRHGLPPFSSLHPMKKIVFWNAWFGDSQWQPHMNSTHVDTMITCGNHRCLLSVDRSDPLKYDALVFHTRDSQNPPNSRTPNQVYVALVHENPIHRGNAFMRGKLFYNWTATYNQDSDVWMPYFSVRRKDAEKHQDGLLPKLPQLTYRRNPSEAMILWGVSNCRTPGKRELYVDKLKKHIKVDIYGHCGVRCKDKNCLKALANSGRYKFYLSFENAVCKDYITEKASKPLISGLVPVVYGGISTNDYNAVMPPNSFIDVRNFNSTKDLAEYLYYLDKNHTAYMEYFAWRHDYYILDTYLVEMCPLCKVLNNRSMARHKNVDFGQFMNVRDCDSSFLIKHDLMH